ncbi:hypothetical protein O181_069125 [Austropuccinia psidii MF-1]|uniref:Uncharacterized protein n=1 Tax=Austropuccinia psidii MF-1 TaxID=1389203 RepID=A0A9Q3ETV3_9BASI|nr:hypothetical protein [Austropuccinia psidii MF-1]
MNTTNRHILGWQIAIQEYIGNRTIIYKEGRSHTNSNRLSRWKMDNFKRNPAYDPEVAAKVPIHFMEIDRRKNFRFSECAPEGGTPDIEDTESEGTETPILGIGSSELHNEFFSEVIETYDKHKQCSILLQLLQKKYRSLELESQLEEPWLRDYKDNKFFLIDGLLYHREKHTSALKVIDRKHISLMLQECHDFPYLGHMSGDRTREVSKHSLVAQMGTRLIGKNAVEVRLTEECSRKHPVFPVSLVRPYFQTGEDKFPCRKNTSNKPEIAEREDSPGPVKKIIKARKMRLKGKDKRQYFASFRNQTAEKDKWLEEDAIPYGNLRLRRFRASRRTE